MQWGSLIITLLLVITLYSQENSDVYLEKPDIISRTEWEAREAKENYVPHTPQKITVHHTYRPLASDFAGAATIKQIQNFHMDTREWADIGYHFLIGVKDSKSFVYQGRPENVVGAHARGANTDNVGISFIGDYNEETIHPQGYTSLIYLLSWLCQHYQIDSQEIYGHRDFGDTECPGAFLYAMLPQIKKDTQFVLNASKDKSNNIFIGFVYDHDKGIDARIVGAQITLETGEKTITDESGMFQIQVSQNTTYKVAHPNYIVSSSQELVISNNKITWNSTALKK